MEAHLPGGKPPNELHWPTFEYDCLTKDGTGLFDWEKYKYVEVWVNPISGVEEGTDRYLIGIGWRKKDGKPELIECIQRLQTKK